MYGASIAICAYNEESNMPRLLLNITRLQTLPQDSRILVVASGCTDLTVDIVRRFAQEDDRVQLLVEEHRHGKIEALNKAFARNDRSILVHMDADHVPCEGAIASLLSHFRDPEVGAVSGRQFPWNEDRFMYRLNRVVWGIHNQTQLHLHRHKMAQHLGGVLFAVRSFLCRKIPPDIVNDDAYLGVACRRAGFRVVYDEKATCYFRAPESIRELAQQRRRVIFGHLMVRRRTGIYPMVFEMLGPSKKVAVLAEWFSSADNLVLLPYFLACILLELAMNLAARHDLRARKSHTVWKVARSTKKPIPLNLEVLSPKGSAEARAT